MTIKVAALLASVMLWAGVNGQAAPDKLREERARRLSSQGRVLTKETKLFPVDRRKGEIISLDIPGNVGGGAVKAFRLHFSFNAEDLKRKGQDGTWSVLLTYAGGQMTWRFDSKSDPEADDFWSPELTGQSVTVQVSSEVPDSELRLLVDKRIEYLEPVQEESIVGKDDTVEITKVTNAEQLRWARSVARLTFVSEDDQTPYTCTGFLIAPDILMTNDHCPRSLKEKRSSVVEFDYDTALARTKMYRLKQELRGMRDENLDFVLYRLNKPVTDRGYLTLKDEDQNLKNQKPLIIIQHPGGQPKRLASFNCQVKTPAAPLDPASDFGHECDTEGGSSGSPVQNSAGLVVGLHHYGFGNADNPALQINQAVKMGEILKFIKAKDQELFKALTAAQQPQTHATNQPGVQATTSKHN